MDLPRITSIQSGSPADGSGLAVGDFLYSINGETPTDVIQYQLLVDQARLELIVQRDGIAHNIGVFKGDGEPLGVEVQTAIFDQVRTCDNHCSFCFIYQLPKGMRPSLYTKDDDYRLSFLYGNYTTLTRFNEADLERVVSENLSPLYVSIHATDPVKRSQILRNRRGGPSLRWLSALLAADVDVHGQIVLCPGINDGDVLEDTLVTVLNKYSRLASLAIVPLGLSDHSREKELRVHTKTEAATVLDLIDQWQPVFKETLGHPMVYGADEFYLLADRELPAVETYGEFALYEDGVGMARRFEAEFYGQRTPAVSSSGFFAWVDGAPADGYRAPRTDGVVAVSLSSRTVTELDGVTVLTGAYAKGLLKPLVDSLNIENVEVKAVPNRFFGGNIAVAGLLVGQDVAAVLDSLPVNRRYLLPDVCLSHGKFLDGMTLAELPRRVEVIPTDGDCLRQALLGRRL